MKYLIILICAIALVFDLADDGCLGKVKFIDSHNAGESFVISCVDQDSGKIHFHFVLPPENWQEFHQEFSGPPAWEIVPSFKINNFCFFSSSGGIPL